MVPVIGIVRTPKYHMAWNWRQRWGKLRELRVLSHSLLWLYVVRDRPHALLPCFGQVGGASGF